jgi:hypothetical protein
MLYCDSRCSQTLTGLPLAPPSAVPCNATCRLGDRQRVILHQRVRGSVRAVRAVWNTRVFQMETRVVADVSSQDTPKYTSEYAPMDTSEHVLKCTPGYAPKDAPNCTGWHTPSLLEYTLQSQLSRRSRSHSRARSEVYSRLYKISHSQPA